MGLADELEEKHREEYKLAEKFYQTITSDEYVKKVNGMAFVCFQFTHKQFTFLMIIN